MEEGLLVVKREGRWLSDLKEEGKRLGYVAAPMVTVTVFQYLLQTISAMMVGHLGELALSSSAIATSLAGVTGFSLLLGMSGGLETLCGQAYGAQQYQKLGIHTYRAIFSLVLVCIPICLIWVSMGKFLSLVGQDPLIAREAGKYIVWMIPGLFAYGIAQPLMKFLQSQSLTFPMLLSSTAILCMHIPLCWILVFKSSLGYVGAALSVSISYWLNVLILGLYIRYSVSCKATRSPFSVEAFKGINEFLRLALPSAVMTCLEWWSFELIILLSGILPNPKLETSVLSICLNTISLLYTIPSGLGAAASTRISNELGAGNADVARLVVQVVMLVAVTVTIIIIGTIFALRDILGYAYSNEKEVADYVTDMVPLICMSVFVDGLLGVFSGVARGCGWQHIGAYVNFGAYYLIGIPTSVVLGFLLHLRGKGLWIGILVGTTTQIFVLSLITGFSNWEQLANIARERIFEGNSSIENLVEEVDSPIENLVDSPMLVTDYLVGTK